jgi:hypothetical protein
VNDPAINAAITAAEGVVGEAARARAWANIDRMLVDRAVAIPWQFSKATHLESKDVRGINDLWNAGAWDYAYTSLKP